jgi:chemotaxis signal transduction protein
VRGNPGGNRWIVLRAARGQQQAQAAKRLWNLLVFSVDGLTLAARTEDVGGVSPWTESIPVPSQTPFVQAMLKRGDQVMPVYDLATRLNRRLQGQSFLCLVARQFDGPMAICIDAELPSLETVEATSIRPGSSGDLETLGSVTIQGEEVTIVALRCLGRLPEHVAFN